MKYLLGLMVAFALSTASFAQDTKGEATEECEENEVMFGEPDQGFTKMERVGDTGSVYYSEDPSLNERMDNTSASAAPDDESNVEEEFGTDTRDLEVESEIERDVEMESRASVKRSSLFTVGKQCSLNSLLQENQGDYKYKQEMDGADIKIKQEKDGEAKIKYGSENEYYDFEQEEDGTNEYAHGIVKGNEVIEIVKHKDGSADVFYQGHFNNIDEARALENGLNFEGVQSVCNQ